MAFRLYDIVTVLPFLVIGAALLTMAVLFVLVKLGAEVIVELLIASGTIWLIVIAVMLFVGLGCASIEVRELFTDAETLATLENQVCGLMTNSDKFIASNVGQPGQDNPALLAASLAEARGKDPVTQCALTPEQIEERISRMENTLANFTGPQLKKTYETTVPCKEGFAPAPVNPATFPARLQAIKEGVDKQTSLWLTPIQKKETDIKAGILSDCEKKKGAKAAIVGSGAPPVV
jgi:hypothetical protein